MIKRLFLLAIVMVMLTGCGYGVNALRISSIPNGAKVYANGEYLGETPKSVPSKWWMPPAGDTVKIRLEKAGCKVTERNIPWSELNTMYWQHDYAAGSEFGNGNTFSFTINLDKE